MLFNSLSYVIFLPVVFVMYWVLPHKLRNVLLLVASYYFYMSWNPRLVALLLFTTAISFFSAKAMGRCATKTGRKNILMIATVLCLGVLFFYKYFDFASNTFVTILQSFSLPVDGISLGLILPMGISFYTFQTLSYVIDVYHQKLSPENNFFTYALYISFFPQLVAGPIERAEHLLPQFHTVHKFSYANAANGAKRIALGMFKKVVIANSIAPFIDTVFANLEAYSGFVLVLAVFLFAIQIYCDFAGYSEVALGSAKILGFDLMENFKSPYLSQGLKEFWGRWHISLSSWFRDYVYIPLGGNRVSAVRHYFNIMVTFLLSGLWHGASWNFVLWGGLHGVFNIAETVLHRPTRIVKLPLRVLRWFITFCLVCAAWVFFRADNISQVTYIFQHMVTGITSFSTYLQSGLLSIQQCLGVTPLYFLCVWLLLLGVCDWANYDGNVLARIHKIPKVLRWGLYLTLIYTTIVYFILQYNSDTSLPFIYFQF